MAKWISLSPQGQKHVEAISAALSSAKSNYLNARNTAIESAKSDLKGDMQRIKDGTWITTSKDNIPIKKVIDEMSKSSSSSPVPAGGGGSGGGGGFGQFPAVEEEDPYDKIIKMVQDTTKANNEWSAAQAKKQMDFQKMMSDTAHQREIVDLQKAGLNPVLSAGGNGASTPSGAMGDTDTSNTRVIAEIAMEALNAMANTASGAVGVARRATSKNEPTSFLGKISNLYATNKLFKQVVNTGLNLAASAGRYKMVKAILR